MQKTRSQRFPMANTMRNGVSPLALWIGLGVTLLTIIPPAEAGQNITISTDLDASNTGVTASGGICGNSTDGTTGLANGGTSAGATSCTRASDSNNLTINSGAKITLDPKNTFVPMTSTRGLHAAYTADSTAAGNIFDNTLRIKGGSTVSTANTVYITAGMSTTASSATQFYNNNVIIDNSTVGENGRVFIHGLNKSGSSSEVKGNSVSLINNSTVKAVAGIAGTYLDNGGTTTLSENTVTIDKSKIESTSVFSISGARNSDTSATGTLKLNAVTIANNSMVGDPSQANQIYGSWDSGKGAAEQNTLNIANSTVYAGTIYGASRTGGGTSTMTKNAITISGTTTVTQAASGVSLYGAYGDNTGDTGDLSENRVSISGGQVGRNGSGNRIYGAGTRGGGALDSNQVDIGSSSGNTAVYAESIYGGARSGSSNSAITNNTVTIRQEGGNTTTVGTSVVNLSVYGGYAISGTGALTGNGIRITGGTIGDNSQSNLFYGAYAGGNATMTNNAVEISGGTSTLNGLYGAYRDVSGGTAALSGNTIKISGGIATNTTTSSSNLTIAAGNINSNSDSGALSNNNISISNARIGIVTNAVNTRIYSARTKGNGSITNNTLRISDAVVYASAFYAANRESAGSGGITGNTITISGHSILAPTINVTILAASALDSSDSGTLSGNKISMTGGQVGIATYSHSTLYGVYTSGTGDVILNEVNISSTSNNTLAYVKEIYGGARGIESGAVKKNTVTISGGAAGYTTTVGGSASALKIYGGYAIGGSGELTENSININGGTVGNAGCNDNGLYGAYTAGSGNASANIAGDYRSGNRLSLTGSGYNIKGVQNFQFYDFILPNTVNNGDTMLTVTDAVTLNPKNDPGKPTGIQVTFTGSNRHLVVGDRFNLISSTAGITNDPAMTKNITAAHGVSLIHDLEINTDANSLFATITGTHTSPGIRDVVNSTAQSGLTVLNGSSDFLINSGMLEAQDRLALDGDNRLEQVEGINSGDGVDMVKGRAFAAVGGWQMRYNSGGGNTMSGLSMVGGVAGIFSLPVGAALAGPFVESGWGSYHGTGTTNVHFNGRVNYYGGGLLGRYELGNAYTEVSARVGRVENQYNSDLSDTTGATATYKKAIPYYGAHATLGYIFGQGGPAELDLRTSYIWNHQSKNTVDIVGDSVTFGSINSHRWINGARLNLLVDSKMRPYVGVSYESEFGSKASARVQGLDIPTSSLKGGTGVGELGLVLGSNAESVKVDIGLQAYTGKRDGLAGSLRGRWNF